MPTQIVACPGAHAGCDASTFVQSYAHTRAPVAPASGSLHVRPGPQWVGWLAHSVPSESGEVHSRAAALQIVPAGHSPSEWHALRHVALPHTRPRAAQSSRWTVGELHESSGVSVVTSTSPSHPKDVEGVCTSQRLKKHAGENASASRPTTAVAPTPAQVDPIAGNVVRRRPPCS
jgi:hypothetical protein